MSGTCSLLEILFRKKVSYSRTVLLHADSTCQIFIWALQSSRITLTSFTLKTLSPRHSFTSIQAHTSICFLFRCTAENSCCKGAQSANRNTDAMICSPAYLLSLTARCKLPCSDPIRSVSTMNKEALGTKTMNWCSFLTFLVLEFYVWYKPKFQVWNIRRTMVRTGEAWPEKSGGLGPDQFFYASDFGTDGRKAIVRTGNETKWAAVAFWQRRRADILLIFGSSSLWRVKKNHTFKLFSKRMREDLILTDMSTSDARLQASQLQVSGSDDDRM